jgi:hypothetical protein
MFQYRLSHIALGMLAIAVLLAILLGGAVNNSLSAGCIAIALLCLVATGQAKEAKALGLISVMGWLFLAALISAAFRIR